MADPIILPALAFAYSDTAPSNTSVYWYDESIVAPTFAEHLKIFNPATNAWEFANFGSGSGGGGGNFIPLSQKGANGGVATLGSNGLVPTDELGTGTADNTVFLRGDGTWVAVSGSAGTLAQTLVLGNVTGGTDLVVSDTDALDFGDSNTIYKNGSTQLVISDFLGYGIEYFSDGGGHVFKGASVTSENTLNIGKASTYNGNVQFFNDINANAITILSPTTSTSYDITLPTSQGSSGQTLENNGSGVLSWITPSSGISGLTTNELVYGDSATSIASLPVATYPSLTELTYVKGVTSAIQTQLNAKAPLASPTFTGTVTTPAAILSSETASRVAIIDGSKNIKSADTATYPSLTELAYVKGVTRAVQTQLDEKLYSMFGGSASLNPADATDYHFSNIPSLAPITTVSNRKIFIPFSGTVTHCIVSMVTGSVGSNEASTIYLRLNNTTDYSIGTTLDNSLSNSMINATMSFSVTSGDYITCKWTAPTWVTNPASVLFNVTFFILRS